MNRTGSLIAGALIAASALAVLPARAASLPALIRKPAPTHSRGPEHDRLTALAGTWDAEMTFWFQPGAPGVKTKATSTIRPLLGGLFIEEKIDGTLNDTPFTTLS